MFIKSLPILVGSDRIEKGPYTFKNFFTTSPKAMKNRKCENFKSPQYTDI